MAYATINDMFKRYSRQSLMTLAEQMIDYDDAGQPAQTVDDVINAALQDASVEIDGYLDSRVTLPLSVVPAPLVRLTCVFARYALEDISPTDKATKEREQGLSWLRSVASGDISLGLSSAGERPESSDTAIMSSDGSVWNRNRSKGFI